MGSVVRPAIRATFLLRCVIQIACVLAIAGFAALGVWAGWSGWAVLAIPCLVVAAIIFLTTVHVLNLGANTGSLLPQAIEHFLVERARRRGVPAGSIWFLDLDQQAREQMAQFHEDTQDNPTLR